MTEPHLKTKKFFRISFFIYFIWNSLLLLAEHEHFLTKEAFNSNHDFTGKFSAWLYYLFWNEYFYDKIVIFMIAQIILLSFSIIFNISSRIYIFICCYLTINIMNRFLPQLDGGHNITLILLSFMPFVNTSGIPQASRVVFSQFFASASNAFFFLCKAQVAILYFSCVLIKLQGKMWRHGTAMYYILFSDEFYHPIFSDLIRNNDFLITFTTYSTILWEMSYLFLIWANKWRLILIGTSILFHLGTIYIMGLTTFGVAMILCNALFLRDSEWEYISKYLKNLWIVIKEKYVSKIAWIVTNGRKLFP